MSSNIWPTCLQKYLLQFLIYNFFFFLHHDQSSQSCYAYTCSWIKSWAFCLVAVTVIKTSGFFPVSILSLLKKTTKSLSISYKMTVANSTEALDLSPLLIQMELTPIGGSDIVLVLFLFSLLPISLSSTYTVPFDVCCSIFTKQER